MVDIAMCQGDGCPLRHDCYRYKAIPSTRQPFFTSIPFREISYEEGSEISIICEHHIEIPHGERVNEKD